METRAVFTDVAVVYVARLLLDKFECHIFYMSSEETFFGKIMTLINGISMNGAEKSTDPKQTIMRLL